MPAENNFKQGYSMGVQAAAKLVKEFYPHTLGYSIVELILALDATEAAPPSASAARIATIEQLRYVSRGALARIVALENGLEPFGRNARALSLSKALGHITREDLLRADSLLSTKEGE